MRFTLCFIILFYSVFSTENIISVTRTQINLSESEGLSIFDRNFDKSIQELLNNKKKYSSKDFKKGLEFMDGTLIIENRYKGDIVSGIKIGDSANDIIIKLGKSFEKIKDENFEYMFYKTKEFSLMFIIKDKKIYESAISKTFITIPIESFDLRQVLSLIDKGIFSIFEFNNENFIIEGQYFDDNRYKAYYKNGLEICEGYIDNYINVYRDYKGDFFEFTSEKFTLNYVDIDSNFARLLEKYEYYRNLFENGLISPQNSKVVISNYERSTYYYTKIRYLDFGRSDIEIFEYFQNMKWIDDILLWFGKDSKYSNEISVFDTLSENKYSLKEKFGISDGELEDTGKDYFSIRTDEELNCILFRHENGLKLSLEKPKVITNIKEWKHPLKVILEKQGMTIRKIELINKEKYPIITVEKLTKEFSKEDLESIIKANGFWDIRIRDSDYFVKIFGDKENKTYKKAESSNNIFTYENAEKEAERLIVEKFAYKLLEKDNEYFGNIYSDEGIEVYLKFFDFNEKGQFEVRVSPTDNFLNVYHYYFVDLHKGVIEEE